MMIQNFEIFPTLKVLKDSLLQAFEQHLKKNMVSPINMEHFDDKERKK
jgi:hypothetical protein